MSSAEKSLCDFGQITVLSELCSALTKGLDQEVSKEVCYVRAHTLDRQAWLRISVPVAC